MTTPKIFIERITSRRPNLVKSMDLRFDLNEDVTMVQARLIMTRNKQRVE